MEPNKIEEEEIKKKTLQIDVIYNKSLSLIDEWGRKAVLLIKDIRQKREKQKIDELSKELKK